MPDIATPLNTSEIDKLLDVDPNEVATTGIMADLKKGMADGFGALAALLKGKMSAPPDKDEPDEEPADDAPAEGDPEPDGNEHKGGPGDGDGDDPADKAKKADPDDPEDKKGPGFDDMRLGKDGELQIDATEYLLGLEAKVDSQAKQITRLQKAVIDGQLEMREAIAALGGVLAPMAKAILQSQQSLLDIPAAVHDSGRIGRNAVVKTALENARKAVDTRIDVTMLAKGLKTEVITEAQKQRFQATGAFSTDEAVHNDIVTRLLK